MQKFAAWHKQLSKAGKIGLWSLVGFMGLMGIGAANPTPPATINTSNTAAVRAEKPTTVSKVVTKEETKTEPVPFNKTTKDDASLAKGTSKVTTPGSDGIKTSIFTVTYTDGVESKRTLKSESVTTQPVTEVTSVGTYVAPAPAPAPATQSTSSCDPNYTPCIPYVSYDLDCKDVATRVQVIGTDHYRLDGNHDGVGCESY